jgi:hypothetical protein
MAPNPKTTKKPTTVPPHISINIGLMGTFKVAEILGDPYSKKSSLPSIGNSHLSVTPRIPGFRLLGQP